MTNDLIARLHRLVDVLLTADRRKLVNEAADEIERLRERAERAEAERDALRKDAERLLALLSGAMNWIYEAGTMSGHGFYRTKNPHDFSPDPELCTPEEIANHQAACDAWSRGEYDAAKEKGSKWLQSEDGKLIAHILRAPWGIGSYSETVPQVQALIEAIDAAMKEGER